MPLKKISASAFLGIFRTWVFYFNGDTLKLPTNFDWSAGYIGKIYEKGDTIIGIGNNPTGLGTYEILGGYARKGIDDEINWFLDDVIEYFPIVGGDIVDNKLFITAAGYIYVFDLSNFNLLKKHILFNVKVESGDIVFIDNASGYLVFSLETKSVIYKFSYNDSNIVLIDSLFIDSSWLSRFKRFDNDIYLILSNGERVRVYRIDKVTNIPKESNIPSAFVLYQNYPNPFNPATTISYDLPVRAHVRLTIYNILGQEVATLVYAEQEPGRYSVKFDASGLPSGIYFYRLQAGNFIEQKKMILIK